MSTQLTGRPSRAACVLAALVAAAYAGAGSAWAAGGLVLAQTTRAAEAVQTGQTPTPDRGVGWAWLLSILLMLVLLAGALLLVMVVLWGGRLRRNNREPLPEVGEPDPYASMRAETRRAERRASSSVEDDFDEFDDPPENRPTRRPRRGPDSDPEDELL